MVEIKKIQPSVIEYINADLAQHYKIIPKEVKDHNAIFYCIQNTNSDSLKDELEFLLGKKIIFEFIESNELYKLLNFYYKKTLKSSLKNSNINVKENNFLEELIQNAKEINSSDIHFEVYENIARVRLRIDGLLIEKHTIPKDNYLELVNKIKIQSNLDITEKRLPQDGRINYEKFDIRVSILPTLHGEKIVMRILGKDSSGIEIEKLGFHEDDKKHYLESVKKTNGIVLISGPTGSGKTTTLYATLKELNDNKRNIVTVEDPIEYTLEGINQVQLKEDIGLTFTSALRSFLRQDPDIIMLGEIRDTQTAQMAIRASLTGHLVLSTIHTNSALGTISRLIDMGVPAFLIAETLNISVAQRLLRKLCNSCKKTNLIDPNAFPIGFIIPNNLKEHYIPVGCDECYHTGYKGRTAIYEVIPITNSISKNIKTQNISSNILEKDHQTLSKKAFDLYQNGTTSLEEIYSILINND